jgi:hypothetical protein
MQQVNQDQVTASAAGLFTYASDLGLHPGQWPDYLELIGEERPKMFMKQQRLMKRWFEVEGYEYRARDGVILTVYND